MACVLPPETLSEGEQSDHHLVASAAKTITSSSSSSGGGGGGDGGERYDETQHQQEGDHHHQQQHHSGESTSSSLTPMSTSTPTPTGTTPVSTPLPTSVASVPEIPTKSIEHTLLPLVQQITTLVNAKERSFCSERTLRAISRVGQSVNIAVERFVTVGEAIADDSDEIRPQMYAACQEARASGAMIEKLCDYGGKCIEGGVPRAVSDRAAMVRAARSLLAAVTRVLLLADSVVVKQLLLAKAKVSSTLTRLESVTNFTEFVKAFSQFGSEMVELAQLTGDRQADLKDERRRAQMGAARHVLERSTLMLLTSAKTVLKHPDCPNSRENRDTVFCQMRRAMDLIHYVVKDGVLDSAAALVSHPSSSSAQPSRIPKQDDWEGNHSLSYSLQRFLDQVEVSRMTMLGPQSQSRTQLPATIEHIMERIQDFTDSAYTAHEHRENILLLCDRVRLQLNQLLGSLLRDTKDGGSLEVESAIEGTLKSVYELRTQLQEIALLQAGDMVNSSKDASELIGVLRNAALTTDADRLDEVADSFGEHLDHSQEVCKLLRHISPTDSLHVQAKYAEINLKIYGPQLAVAARVLCSNPTSKIAKENFDVFSDMWQSLMEDVASLTNDMGDVCRTRAMGDKNFYMSLPRPGKHGTTKKPMKAVKLDNEEQEKIAKSALDMKLVTSDLEAEAEKWGEENYNDENNDIVRRAKNMSTMAFNMYQFTKGEGALRTTQDLFTQAEYFAEEANRLYKVIRQFSYTVPTSVDKKDLLEKVDEIPNRVQQLQFTVKNPTVGKAATFTKVDSVIQETKNLMNVISKVVTTCFECASKYMLSASGDSINPNQYKLDFRGLSPRGRNSPYRTDAEDQSGGAGMGDSKVGGGGSSDGSM
ncbi:alpha-catulin isoform X3 [Folsomia candida]|uniref:alpha-catulin isoform X3 n=1 Tax=Folsomia candida TaxID=158441 RepID=UPI0016055AA8|nr:alpha-catulin isoform X3 [Folsomia candida]